MCPSNLEQERRGIEFNFALPIPVNNPSTGDPILISGRMDAICDFAGGVYIVDEDYLVPWSYLVPPVGSPWSSLSDMLGDVERAVLVSMGPYSRGLHPQNRSTTPPKP